MKTAVAAGAAQGLGLVTARQFAVAGYRVILADLQDVTAPAAASPRDLGEQRDVIARGAGVPVELSPLIVRRFKEPTGLKVLGTGFPDQMTDDDPEEPGHEVVAAR